MRAVEIGEEEFTAEPEPEAEDAVRSPEAARAQSVARAVCRMTGTLHATTPRATEPHVVITRDLDRTGVGVQGRLNEVSAAKTHRSGRTRGTELAARHLVSAESKSKSSRHRRMSTTYRLEARMRKSLRTSLQRKTARFKGGKSMKT